MPPQSDSHPSPVHGAMPTDAFSSFQPVPSSAASASHADLSDAQPGLTESQSGLREHAKAQESVVTPDRQNSAQQACAAPDTPRTAHLKDMAAQADRLMQVSFLAFGGLCRMLLSHAHTPAALMRLHVCRLVVVTSSYERLGIAARAQKTLLHLATPAVLIHQVKWLMAMLRGGVGHVLTWVPSVDI